VADLPEYIHAGKHFGKNIKSIEELNEILLVTGKIDTTSESPPISLAIVVIDKKKIMLTLIKAKKLNDEISEEYSGSGYDLTLAYKEKKSSTYTLIYEGNLIIKDNKLKSQYKVIGVDGYH
jgi:hypothetical protein